MSDLLPVIVADLAEDSGRGALEEVARVHGAAWVPLVSAPADASRHLLEVYTPGSPEPLRLIAEAVGPPGPKGFPLRLSLIQADDVAAPLVAAAEERAAESPRPVAGTSRHDTPAPLSSEHVAALAGEPRAPVGTGGAELVGRTLAGGKLELEELVGRGSLGSVYRARHKQLFVTAAVKVLHEDFQHDVDFCRRFYAEALAASRLDHLNLVRVFDFGQEPDGLLYLSMEYLEGASLREVLDQAGPLSSSRIAEIMLQVCAGLGHAHARGLVHRDVRLENIRLVMGQDDDGNAKELVKVSDFGIALLKSSGSEERQRTLRPTPEYMSPEQLRGEELDGRSDVYACGIVLHELATGQVPFKSDKPIIVVNRHLSMPPPPISEVRPGADPRLERIIQKALAKSREDRHADVRELRADLKALLRAPSAAEIAMFDLQKEAARIASSIPPKMGAPSIPPPAAKLSVAPAPSFSLPPPTAADNLYAYDSVPRAAPVPRFSSQPGPLEAPRSDPPPAASRPSPSAPPKRASDAPAWLEIRDEGMAKFLGHMGDQVIEELADTLATDPVKWLSKLTTERDIRTFVKMLSELEVALRTLAARADAKALWAVSSTLHGLATEGTQGPGTRGARAAVMMRFFSDPGTLSPLAERLLSHDDDHREAAQTLLRRAGVAGAYALYGARVKLATRPGARAPFVKTMYGLGQAAWPVVRAALEKIPDAALTGGHPLAALLAEDLLLSVPIANDEAAGELALKFVRAQVPPLCRAAAIALARLWAERARPVLLGLLADADEGVRVASLHGLLRMGAVDEHLVKKVVPIVRRLEPASPELRGTVVAVLEAAAKPMRPLAMQLLAELVRDPTDDGVVLAAARALAHMAKAESRPLIAERAGRASEPLRAHLEALLAS